MMASVCKRAQCTGTDTQLLELEEWNFLVAHFVNETHHIEIIMENLHYSPLSVSVSLSFTHSRTHTQNDTFSEYSLIYKRRK